MTSNESNGQRCAALNPTRFLNRAQVKRFLLEQAANTRAHKFTRVSQETLVEANELIRQWAVRKVQALPSKGATI